MRGQGSFEYLIMIAVIILVALIIVISIGASGVLDMRRGVRDDLSEIKNLLRDVSISYSVNQYGIVQIAIRANVDDNIMVYNFTINECVIEINDRVYDQWKAYSKNCGSFIQGVPREAYEYECSLKYTDQKLINRSETGLCIGQLES